MLKKIKSKFLKSKKNSTGRGEEAVGDALKKDTPSEMLQLLEEYSNIKEDPIHISGEDFDRAFGFLEKYPESMQAKQLIEEMKSVSGSNLKGLSYESAVNILTKMADHPGAQSIIGGMYQIEKDYIQKLISDVLLFILEIAPDHPHMAAITEAVVSKNFTNSYNFITKNPEHQATKMMIREMFKKDPNIAILLLQEKMDHPQVDSIIEGIYGISPKDVAQLTPNAVIFILEVAPDHIYAEKLINRLVEENYIKAFDFVKEHMEYPNAQMMIDAVCARKPELKELFKL